MPVSDFYTATFSPDGSQRVGHGGGQPHRRDDQAGLVRGRAVPGRDHGRGGRVHGADAAGQAAEHADPDDRCRTWPGRTTPRRASISQIASTWSTAPTVSTAVGGVLAAFELPLAPGRCGRSSRRRAPSGACPALGNTAANTGLHLFVTASVATSAVYSFDLIFSE